MNQLLDTTTASTDSLKQAFKQPSIKKQQQPQSIKQSPIKYVILAFAAFATFGNNYAFDNPQALQKQIMNDVGITITEYNLLYSIFSLPNVFLTLASGCFIDYIGGRTSMLIFSVFVTFSQLVIAFGATNKLFNCMLFGRALFGISSENLVIAQQVIITTWFKGAELSTATGIILTLPEISSALNSFLSPMIYEYTESLAYPLGFSIIVCLFSLGCAIFLICFDKLLDDEQFNQNQQNNDSNNVETTENFQFAKISAFSKTFWILVIICMLSLGIYIAFMDDISDFYQEKFKFNSVLSGRLIMIPYLISAFFSPFIGSWVDRFGYRRFLLMITCILFTTAYLLFGCLHSGIEIDNPNWMAVLPLIMLGRINIITNIYTGIGYSFYSCVMIPSIQNVVDQKIMGTAFGILGTSESIALSLFPVIGSQIVTQADSIEEGFSKMSLFYALIGLLALFFCISLYFVDHSISDRLDYINPHIVKPQKPDENMYSLILNKEEEEEQVGQNIIDQDNV